MTSASDSPIAFRVNPPRRAFCWKPLSLSIRDAGAMAITAPLPPDASSLSKAEFGGAICSREAAAGSSEISSKRRIRTTPLSASATTAIFFFFSSASDLIFLPGGLNSNTTSCSRIAMARARGGILASVRSTARSACLRSNWVSALALSGLATILRCSRELVVLSMVASLAANRASGPLASPTAKTSVSDFSQIREPHTVAIVRITVSAAKSSICLRLLLTTRTREGGPAAGGVRTSALMARIRPGRFTALPIRRTARRNRKYLKKNDNSSVPG